MNTKKIAVTGGIGSGKSTVLSFLKEQGYSTFSCDEIYKTLFDTENYIASVKRIFPNAVQNGKIDKKILSDIVFKNDNARKQLNDLAHPLIIDTLFDNMNKCQEELVFAEVPLLFEGNYQHRFDGVIVVLRSIENRIQAVMQRDNVSTSNVQLKINAQNSYNIEDLKKQHHTIYFLNNNSLEQLKKDLNQILQDMS